MYGNSYHFFCFLQVQQHCWVGVVCCVEDYKFSQTLYSFFRPHTRRKKWKNELCCMMGMILGGTSLDHTIVYKWVDTFMPDLFCMADAWCLRPSLFRDGVTHLNVVIQLFLEICCSCKLAHFHRYDKTKAFCYVKCFGSIFLIFYANPINWKCAGHGIRMSVHFASHIFFSSFSFFTRRPPSYESNFFFL